ncbi:phosphopantetheine-binding protein [Pontixanthobacter sp.]|uniref:phosphopantetheine-binding protein n=1 Tax=Pontixanthobacter sp. TaxID=2792078 RepID=UPI003C7BE0F8
MDGDRVTNSTHNAPKPDDDADAEASGSTSPSLAPSRHVIDTQLRAILCDVLGLDSNDVETFDSDTGLFGHLPELDSMAVAGLLTEMEDRMDIIIDDDDVDGEMLETFGGLLAFAEAKAVTG